MLKIGTGKSRSHLEGIANPSVGEDGYIRSDSKLQARKPVPFLRILGNLLILAGLALLLGIGGWWGYTQYENRQFLISSGVTVEPTVDVASLASITGSPTPALATVTPVVIPDLADLTNNQGPSLGNSLIPTITP